MKVHQLIFGYRDGHRQLDGSTDLGREEVSLLLGATDAPITKADDRFITGLPLPSAKLYALSFTWSAPEAGRPGAVWAHTLLVSFDDLDELNDPTILVRRARRPRGRVPDGYGESIWVDFSKTVTNRHPPNAALMTELIELESSKETPRVLVHPNLREAEETLLFLWGEMWAALKREFSFRTREAVRVTGAAPYLAVAREVRGVAGQTSHPRRPEWQTDPRGIKPPRWIATLAHHDSPASELSRFISTFGPYEETSVRSLSYLGELADSVQFGDVSRAVRLLSKRHPRPSSGMALKAALFGVDSGFWWRVAELEVLTAILGTSKNLFDIKELRLSDRLARCIRQGHVAELATARVQSGPKAVRSSLVDALVRAGDVLAFQTVLQLDFDLAVDAVIRREDLIKDPGFWRRLPPDQAAQLLARTPNTESTVAAARAGQFGALLQTTSFGDLVYRFAKAGAFGLVKKIGQAFPHEAAESSDSSRLVIGAADIETIGIDSVLGALENRRGDPSEYWLRSAVNCLVAAKPSQIPMVLEVAFGPLHSAITEDRLPHDLWSQLDKILPKASDPALRLRLFLIRVARRGDWSKDGVKRAVRDAGPYIENLRKEVNHKDSAWKILRSALGPERH